METESFPLANTFSLGEYFSVLRRRKWLILAITVLGTVGALDYARVQTPMYQSTVSLIVASSASSGGGSNSQSGIGSDALLITTQDATKCVSLLLHDPTFTADPTSPTVNVNKICAAPLMAKTLPPAGIVGKVQVIPGKSGVLQIVFQDDSARKAQTGAQAFALSYVHLKLVQGIASINRTRAPLLAAQKRLLSQLASLNTQIAETSIAIRNAIAVGLQPVALKATLSNLESQRKRTDGQLSSISSQLLNLDPAKVVTPQLVSPAQLPKKPFSPQKTLIGLFGLVGGLVLGVILAFIRDRFDDSLRGKADIEANFGAPVLAMVPKVSRWRRRKDPKLLGLAGEAYRTLRTRLLFDATRDSAKVFMITSANAGEGKTTTASNLAIALAGAGKRVVLVSADLRRPRVQELFGLNDGVGLADLLSGSISLPEVLQDPGIKNLRILASGPLPDRPADLLAQSMATVLADLRGVADFVVLDTPPLLRVADTLELIPMADRMVYVVDPDQTTRSVLRNVREQLDQMGASVLGVVVSNVKPAKARAYGVYIHRLGYPEEQVYLEAHRNGQRTRQKALETGRPESAPQLVPEQPTPTEAETSSS
jgi:capsular exopolysaccharide synthesis family protein